MDVKEYKKLLQKNIQNVYQKASSNATVNINKEAKKITDQLKLSDRVETIAEREAYMTLKDHKRNFANDPKCRLLNPCKSDIGKISKKKLESIVKKTVAETGVNLWRNTKQVLQWFDNIPNKESASFICFDIKEFYPSISKQLLQASLEHAEKYHPISSLDKEIIFHCKETLLFHENEPWQKRNDRKFDIAMGSFDGAEACELVGCYLLWQLNEELGEHISLGLYRDDGLAVTHMNARDTENIKKAMCRIFQKNGLEITIEANKKTIDFLDVSLDLSTQKYHPYLKPGNTPIYINSKSNHPPAVKKAVPKGINKRLCDISSDETEFQKHIGIYQRALENSGFEHKLTYTPDTAPDSAATDKKKRKRQRRILWFNPPYDMQVKTNVAQKFMTIVEECFPKGHKLRKIFNKNSLKVSYCCMPNVQSRINTHNRKVTQPQKAERPCTCTNYSCPLDGKCKTAGIVYQATVTAAQSETNVSDTYIGMTALDFPSRYANHRLSFRNKKYSESTKLAARVWELKDAKIDHDITWKIVTKAAPYNTTTKKCNLCVQEKYYILFHPEMASLNEKPGLLTKCRHSNKFLLAKHPP